MLSALASKPGGSESSLAEGEEGGRGVIKLLFLLSLQG